MPPFKTLLGACRIAAAGFALLGLSSCIMARPKAYPPPEPPAPAGAQQFLAGAEVGQVGDVSDPATGREGSIRIVATYTSAGGRPCKRFVWTETVGNGHDPLNQVACRAINGQWYIVRPLTNPQRLERN